MSFVYKYKFLCWLYCKYTQIKFSNFKEEVESRSKLDLFDYKKISQPLPKCYYELCTDNNCFGIGYCLRKYAGIKKDYINAIVEHGYFFGGYVEKQEIVTFANKILTFGEVRKEHIRRVISDKQIIPIGPYIHYASHYLDQLELEEIKEKLGRVLLVFFSHSGTGCTTSFDTDYMISKINSIKKDYDNVVVSVFWSDLTTELVKRLKYEGYLIFSSGHRYDYYFLSRQKSMIALSDMTMSNSVGTHVGYCTYMNKPHWIINQEIKRVAINKKGQGNIAIDEMMKRDVENEKEKEDFIEAFADYSITLTGKQKEVASKYFGFDYVRNAEEMRSIIL